MRGWLTLEAMPLHHSLEAFANGHASNVQKLSWYKVSSWQLKANRKYGIFWDSELC